MLARGKKSFLPHTRFVVISFGLVAGLLLVPDASLALESAEVAIREICGHIQGNLGGLLMTTAGIGAIVAAAFGNFRASYSLIITAIGAATVSTVMSLYFNDAAEICAGSSDEIQTNFSRSAIALEAPVDFDEETARDIISQDEAAIAIAIERGVDFSRGARFNHGDTEGHSELAETNPALADLADTF